MGQLATKSKSLSRHAPAASLPLSSSLATVNSPTSSSMAGGCCASTSSSSSSSRRNTTASAASTSTCRTVAKRRYPSSSMMRALTLAVRAIDERNPRRLKSALKQYGSSGWSECVKHKSSSSSHLESRGRTGANVGGFAITLSSATLSGDAALLQRRREDLQRVASFRYESPLCLLKYAVEKNFFSGVVLLLQVIQNNHHS